MATGQTFPAPPTRPMSIGSVLHLSCLSVPGSTRPVARLRRPAPADERTTIHDEHVGSPATRTDHLCRIRTAEVHGLSGVDCWQWPCRVAAGVHNRVNANEVGSHRGARLISHISVTCQTPTEDIGTDWSDERYVHVGSDSVDPPDPRSHANLSAVQDELSHQGTVWSIRAA